MATTVERPLATVEVVPEQRIVLRGVSWDTYQRLLVDRGDRRSPRMVYDRGELEIVAPSIEHERDTWRLETIVQVVVDHLGLEFENAGTTTFKREDAERGFEPDTGFYIQHAADVRDRPEIDPAVDPPPDLVIEVDVTSSSLDKLPIYAAMSVPEVWRCQQGRVALYLLRGSAYEEASASAALPLLRTEMLNHLLAEGRVRPRLAWWRWVREWIRQHDADAGPAS